MKNISTSDKIYTGQSRIAKRSKVPDLGRGVFAKTKIRKGELIERCPVIEVHENILMTHVYNLNKGALLALGFGSIYNHNYHPNAKYKIDKKEKTINFIAIKEIKESEEITVNYNGSNSKNKNPFWFEVG